MIYDQSSDLNTCVSLGFINAKSAVTVKDNNLLCYNSVVYKYLN